ncbi:hypothetical protein DC28_03765 [Spirochaeta lutea]|uniref:Uncharacterized protein n=1 Tax=Spirochaeta lutea TaxID=1480694 RepID=A0A098R148_9SPIO|nr:hypothetical protein DC28_03765 [Spirochaeta lutea]
MKPPAVQGQILNLVIWPDSTCPYQGRCRIIDKPDTWMVLTGNPVAPPPITKEDICPKYLN